MLNNTTHTLLTDFFQELGESFTQNQETMTHTPIIRNQYQLLCSYVLNEYYVSTSYRQSSAPVEGVWYFETIVWKWNPETKETEDWVSQIESGLTREAAFKSHYLVVKNLAIKKAEGNGN